MATLSVGVEGMVEKNYEAGLRTLTLACQCVCPEEFFSIGYGYLDGSSAS